MAPLEAGDLFLSHHDKGPMSQHGDLCDSFSISPNLLLGFAVMKSLAASR
jgi:hypothetical protein